MNNVRNIEKEKSTDNTNAENWTIGDVYLNREAIVSHPEQYGQAISRFIAGGGPACVYNKEVSISQLVQCWQHAEYQCKCPECDHEAYIYYFAGHINGGGYWEIRAYCPNCDCGYSVRYPQGLPHWSVMKNILKEEDEKRSSND